MQWKSPPTGLVMPNVDVVITDKFTTLATLAQDVEGEVLDT